MEAGELDISQWTGPFMDKVKAAGGPDYLAGHEFGQVMPDISLPESGYKKEVQVVWRLMVGHYSALTKGTTAQEEANINAILWD